MKMTTVALAHKFALVGVLLTILVITVGAFTRLKDAGLGCPDWPGCYGFLTVPQSHEELAQAQFAFPQQIVEADKAWIEMIHRYLASSLGLLVLVLLVLSLKQRKKAHPLPLTTAVFLTLLVCFQGALGMWTVTLNLRPIIVTGHLLGGMCTLVLLFMFYVQTGPNSVRPSKPIMTAPLATKYRKLTLLGIAILFTQLFLGAWVSTNYAALACPDFPTCQGQWLPPLDLTQAYSLKPHDASHFAYGVLDNTGRVTVHMMHRFGALITTIFLAGLSLSLLRQKPATALKRASHLILGALIIQVGLGIGNIVFILPISLAVAHNGVAALLLLAMINLMMQITTQLTSNLASQRTLN